MIRVLLPQAAHKCRSRRFFDV